MYLPIRKLGRIATWLAPSVLMVVMGMAFLGLPGQTGGTPTAAAVSSDCITNVVACEDQIDSQSSQASEFSEFSIVGHVVYVGGCYTQDLQQVTYLAPDGTVTYVARWCQ